MAAGDHQKRDIGERKRRGEYRYPDPDRRRGKLEQRSRRDSEGNKGRIFKRRFTPIKHHVLFTLSLCTCDLTFGQ